VAVADGSSSGSGLVTQPVTSDTGCVTLPRIRDPRLREGGGMVESPRPLVAYHRVSTAQQGASGLGLEGQVGA
jgi:hypothetical protein